MSHLLESKWAPKTPIKKGNKDESSGLNQGLSGSRWSGGSDANSHGEKEQQSHCSQCEKSCDNLGHCQTITVGSKSKQSSEGLQFTVDTKPSDPPLSHRFSPRSDTREKKSNVEESVIRRKQRSKHGDSHLVVRDCANHQAKVDEIRQNYRMKKINSDHPIDGWHSLSQGSRDRFLNSDISKDEKTHEQRRNSRKPQSSETAAIESSAKSSKSVSSKSVSVDPPSALSKEERERLEKQMADIQNGIFNWADDSD